jgi:hypothetical protein
MAVRAPTAPTARWARRAQCRTRRRLAARQWPAGAIARRAAARRHLRHRSRAARHASQQASRLSPAGIAWKRLHMGCGLWYVGSRPLAGGCRHSLRRLGLQACRSSAAPELIGGGSAAKESERSSGASESVGFTAETLRWRGLRPLLWLDARPELATPLPPEGGCRLAASCAARCLMVRCSTFRISYGPCSTYSVHASPPTRHSAGSGGSSLLAKASTTLGRGWGEGWGDPVVVLW